jgi:outer membrane lipoprotein-sorting protein
MKVYLYLSFIFCISALAVLASPPLTGESLSELLSRMDQASASFTGMTANLKRVDHSEILASNEEEMAQVKLKRSKTGLVGRVDFPEPNRRTVSLRDRTVEVYYPKSNTVQIVDAREFGQQFDQFLLLGFGTSGKDLEKSYTVRLLGPATVGDQKTTHIELIPKSKQMLEYFQKAELWMAQGAPYPVQEKVYTGSQDYKLINYTDVKLNAPLTDKELELQLPAGVKKIYPQK